MEPFLAALASSEIATGLRVSRWGYAAVNATHIIGIALTVGSILPLDLKLLGFWPSVPRETLMRVLVPVAASGAAIALTTGALLFAARAPEYAALTVFQVKLSLIALGIASALALHLAIRRAPQGRQRFPVAGAVSLLCWLGALVAGRLIAFSGH